MIDEKKGLTLGFFLFFFFALHTNQSKRSITENVRGRYLCLCENEDIYFFFVLIFENERNHTHKSLVLMSLLPFFFWNLDIIRCVCVPKIFFLIGHEIQIFFLCFENVQITCTCTWCVCCLLLCYAVVLYEFHLRILKFQKKKFSYINGLGFGILKMFWFHVFFVTRWS